MMKKSDGGLGYKFYDNDVLCGGGEGGWQMWGGGSGFRVCEGGFQQRSESRAAVLNLRREWGGGEMGGQRRKSGWRERDKMRLFGWIESQVLLFCSGLSQVSCCRRCRGVEEIYQESRRERKNMLGQTGEGGLSRKRWWWMRLWLR